MPPPVERISAPQLIDDAAKMYIDVLLQKSHEVRTNRNYTILNITVVVLFLVVFGGFLYYRYKTKPPSQEANYKIMKDQEFVLSKIRWYKEQNDKINQTASPITGLPALDSNDWSASMP
jgi:hypothetical protein